MQERDLLLSRSYADGSTLDHHFHLHCKSIDFTADYGQRLQRLLLCQGHLRQVGHCPLTFLLVPACLWAAYGHHRPNAKHRKLHSEQQQHMRSSSLRCPLLVLDLAG
eukprot:TRINITY_DN15236_c0_g1_i2.p1 TRINITY_DN15236_c0_g1~~TRINITY_DN15236_c0_g1_i2.p1  ORF type:complete len:107 (-),score=4.14 TRINITY_DN15236_c0_g1_i2:59-379(-)